LNIWHVNTICPWGWSALDGEGTEVPEAEVGPGVAEGKLKLVVATGGWVGCGVTFEGVEACSVANRSTGSVETGRLHPAIKAKISKIPRILLWMVGRDGFKVALLTGQDFSAETPVRDNSGIRFFSRRADIFGSKPCTALRQV
jgi:hypothetical protein